MTPSPTRVSRLMLFTLACVATGPVVLHAAAGEGAIDRLKQLDVEDLLDVEVISVTRHASPLSEAPSAIQVITGAQIRRSGATTLAEVLRLADNLQVAQRGTRGWAITARGFNTELANKLLVMIDGRTVYTPLYSGVFWEAQDYLLEDIDRIEVISGPGGTLWGANAVNGVINIITKAAQDTQGLLVEAGTGSELAGIVGLRHGGTLGTGTSYRMFGKYLDREASVFADGTGSGDAWRRAQAGFRLDGTDTGRGSWTLQGDAYANHDQVPEDGSARLRGQNLLGRWTRQWSAGSSTRLQVYYDRTHLSLPVGPLTINGTELSPPGRLQDELQTMDVDFQHRLPLGAHNTLTWGLGFRHTHDVVDNAPALAFLPRRLDQQLYSIFVQDEIRLRDNLALTVGTKVEHNDYTGREFEPSVRLQWQATGTQTAWAAASRAVRAPSRIDRDLYQGPAPYPTILKGGEDFHSESVLAWELGYRARIAARFSAALSTFYNEYRDVRSTTITPDTILPFHFENGVAGHTWGAEWTGTLQPADGWTLRAGYVLLQQRLRVKPGHIDISNGRNEIADPEQQATLRSAVDLPWRMALDLGLRWVDTVHNSNGPAIGHVSSYMELDARLAWQANRHLEISANGANLLRAHHPEYGFPTPTRTEAQRGVYVRLVWRQ